MASHIYRMAALDENDISITASGTGPVNDPLEVYDVVAYAS